MDAPTLKSQSIRAMNTLDMVYEALTFKFTGIRAELLNKFARLLFPDKLFHHLKLSSIDTSDPVGCYGLVEITERFCLLLERVADEHEIIYFLKQGYKKVDEEDWKICRLLSAIRVVLNTRERGERV